MSLRCVFTALAVAALMGCSTARPSLDKIIVQVCLPLEKSVKLISMGTTTSMSASAGGQEQTGLTTNDEPVFESNANDSDAVFETVQIGEGIYYHYEFSKLPKPELGKWSNWSRPSFATSSRISVGFLNGVGFDKLSLSTDAPLLRVIAMPFSSYLGRLDFRRDHGVDKGIQRCSI